AASDLSDAGLARLRPVEFQRNPFLWCRELSGFTPIVRNDRQSPQHLAAFPAFGAEARTRYPRSNHWYGVFAAGWRSARTQARRSGSGPVACMLSEGLREGGR